MDHFIPPQNTNELGSSFSAPAPKPVTRKNSHMGAKIVAFFLATALVAGSAGFGGAWLFTRLGKSNSVILEASRPTISLTNYESSGTPLTPAQLYAAQVASCVGITVESSVGNIFGQTSSRATSGSGFVLTKDGYIVTNQHVIDGATKITVTFQDGTQYDAKLVGTESDNTDVAVLKIDADNLVPVTLGDSSQLTVGETVMAIGNPLGELDFTLTTGIVSALDRLISTDDATTMNMLQTNCAINPGNSGGALFNAYGEVIGITTAKYSQTTSGVTTEGLGFVLPINDLKEILRDLITFGYVVGKPYMGITGADVPPIAQQYGVVAGAAVSTVTKGSAAEKAGLKEGDIITAVGETPVDTFSALSAAVSSYRAGDSATLTVIRQGSELSLTITFDDKNEVLSKEQAEKEVAQTQPSTQEQSQNPFDSFFSQWPFGY